MVFQTLALPLAAITTITPTGMPSTQSSSIVDSIAKVNLNDVGPVNQQPTPALAMSIDSDHNGPGQRAMRLRGGCCCVRHSNAVPIMISNIYAFFSKSKFPAVAAI